MADVELSEADVQFIKELRAAKEEGRISRRDALKVAGALGVGGVVGGAGGATMFGGAAADASTSDSDGNVGLPGDRVDVYADGVDGVSATLERLFDGRPHFVERSGGVSQLQSLIDAYDPATDDYLHIVLIGAGEWDFSTTLNAGGKDNIILESWQRYTGYEVEHTVHLNWTGSTTGSPILLDFQECNYFELRGIQVDGNGGTSPAVDAPTGIAAGKTPPGDGSADHPSCRVENVSVFGCGAGILGGVGTDTKGWLDDSWFEEVLIHNNYHGVDRMHAWHRFTDCTFAGNTNAVNTTSTTAVEFQGCLWSGNTLDVRIDGGLSVLTFTACYFENSANGIIGLNLSSSINHDGITFTGCEFHTSSTSQLMALTDGTNAANGSVVFVGGNVDSTTGSKTISADTFTVVCQFFLKNFATVNGPEDYRFGRNEMVMPVRSSPPSTEKGKWYLDDGTNTASANPAMRLYQAGQWWDMN